MRISDWSSDLSSSDLPNLVHANAADFVEAELATPQPAGTTRVLMHSIVWQYVPADQQARVTAAMEAAGARATADRPRAWNALEANRKVHHHAPAGSSEEGRVGKGGVREGRSRWGAET